MDDSHMGHGKMGHGSMSHGGMDHGGMSSECSMNVRSLYHYMSSQVDTGV